MNSIKSLFLLFIAMSVLFAAPCFGLVSGTVTNTTGKAVSGASVTFTDEANPQRYMPTVTDENGKYQIDLDTTVNVAFDVTATPEPFFLGQNYPNPFNPNTIIPFVLNKAGNVKIEIFTITGQRIRTLINEYRSPGIQSMLWDALDDRGAHVGAGIYLYRLIADGKSDTKKMLLLDGGPGVVSTGGGSTPMLPMGKRAKTYSTTWSVEIKGEGIVTYVESHMDLTDGNTYNFMVVEILSIIFASIPGGTSQMGDVENAGYPNEKPVHSVTVSDFEMGIYEITNAQYAQFLNDAKASEDIIPSSKEVKGAKGTYSGQDYIRLHYSWGPDNKCWITYDGDSFTAVSGRENWPVVWLTWYGAKAFALYYGLDLPTEAEWEYACRGGKQYMYGTDDGTIDSLKAKYNVNGFTHPVAVGSYPPNPYGLYDMSGNVWERCHDWYEEYASSSQTNPSDAQSGSTRVIRGGSWEDSFDFCRSSNRTPYYPNDMGPDKGFRVVRRASPQHY